MPSSVRATASVTYSTLLAALNTTSNGWYGAYGLCNYPSAGQAIRLCGPSAQTTPGANIEASANSFGTIRKMELWLNGVKKTEIDGGTLARIEIWVDGVKEYTETNSITLNTSVPFGQNFPYGSGHEIDVYAVNTAGQK